MVKFINMLIFKYIDCNKQLNNNKETLKKISIKKKGGNTVQNGK